MKNYKVAVVQLDTTEVKERNYAAIEAYIEEAAKQGASLICFPEDINIVVSDAEIGVHAETETGTLVELMRKKAKEYGVYLHAGSFRKILPGETRNANTSLLLDPQGEILAEYHKLHTFDITLPDGTVAAESAVVKPGEQIVTAQTELGCLGFSICYDIRFPELYRLMALRGAQVIFTPANFTDQTGKAHWETILRTRAIENACYIIAADQCGQKPAYQAHGNSMIIDPWGKILARAEQKPGIIYAEIALDMVDSVREKIPALKNRRTDIYTIGEVTAEAQAEQRTRALYQQLTTLLIEKGMSVSTMESATSGQIASLITDTEGASAIMKGAFVTYSNEAKIMQGVPAEVIEQYTVYSRETAVKMAEVCSRTYRADIGIGVTGTMGNVDPANKEASIPGQVYYAICIGEATESYYLELAPQPTRLAYKLAVAEQIGITLMEKLKEN